jgi:hypothetical protein
MNIQRKIFGLLALILIALFVSSCIVSATFVINEKFHFAPKEGFYFYQVNLMENETWDEHYEDIDDIEAVGFVFYISTTAQEDIFFSVYVDDYSGFGSDPSEVPSSADVVLDSLIIQGGSVTSKVSYSTTVGLIEHIDRLKALTKTGQFDVYTTSTGTVGGNFIIDSAWVVVTFSAG